MAKEKNGDSQVTTKEETLPAVVNFEADEGCGFENTDKDSFAIPFLSIAQKLSGQVDKEDAAYIQDCEPGMVFNSVTKELYADGVELIFVYYERRFLEWVLRSQGGGFMGDHDPDPAMMGLCTRDDDNRMIMENGHQLNDTRNHYIITLPDLNSALISMTSSQIKKSRQVMALMRGLKFKGSKGAFTPPTFASIFKASSVLERKDDYTWYGWQFERICDVNDPSQYQVAKDFRESVSKGEKKADYSQASENTESKTVVNDTTPF